MADKTLLSFIGITVIAAFVFFAFANAFFLQPVTPNPNVYAAQAQPNSGEVQVVNLSAQGINYTPSVITVKQNQPVKIVANLATMQGCLKSLVIPAFNVRKVFSDNDNTVEFTPTQKGSFAFSCSMGMGRGTINVV